jgi:quercetin dioxygenase-like cupin family protein
MRRVALALALAAVFAVSTRWTRAQQPAAPAAPQFTGKSAPMDGKDLSVARRSFDAGARTYWHSHDQGQLLYVEEGRMRIQKRGQSMRELGVGESDYTGANVVHWHGATPDRPLVQVNVGFGGGAKWLEPVSDDEYSGKARR